MGITVKSHRQPDESREFPNGSDAFVKVGTTDIGRAEFRPGWRWSNDIRPLAGTASCEVPHFGYMISGTLHVEADDGTTVDLEAGDCFSIPPGHDAWVVGDQSAILLDWSEKTTSYAVPADSVASAAQ